MNMRELSILIIILVLSTCGATGAQDFGKVSDEDWKLQPPADYPESEAVVIFDHGDMEITIKPIRVKLERQVRIKVFDKDRADKALNIEIPYSPGDKLVGLKALTINPDGKEIMVKEFHDKRVGAFRIITFTFPAVEDGAILEYKYKQSHQRISLLDPWYFQNYLYTIESRFSVTPMPGFSYDPMLRYMPNYAKHPQVEDVYTMKGEMKKFTWTLKNLPPFRDEPLAMAELDYRTSVLLQLKEYRDTYQRIPFFKDWGYIAGIIYGRVLQLKKKGEDDLKKLSDSLMNESPAPERYVETCFRYVRDAIALDESADVKTFRDLFKERAAGNIDKNILLSELLLAQGYEAYPMMIGTRDEHSDIDPDVSQLNALNKIICTLGEGDDLYGLDASDQYSVFPYLPKLCRVKNGITIRNDSCFLEYLTHHERKNGCDVLSIYHVDENGSAICSTTVYIKGYSMDGLLKDMDKSLEGTDWFKRIFSDIDMEYKVQDAKIVRDKENDRIKADFVLSFPALCHEIDGNFVFCPYIINCFHDPFTSIYRTTPVDFRVPFQDRTQIKIQLPQNMHVFELPDDIEHTMSNLVFVRHNRASGNVIDISSALKVIDPVFLIPQYPKLKNTFDAIESFKKDEILFTEQDASHE